MNYFHRWTLRVIAATAIMAVVFIVLLLIELVRWIIGLFVLARWITGLVG